MIENENGAIAVAAPPVKPPPVKKKPGKVEAAAGRLAATPTDVVARVMDRAAAIAIAKLEPRINQLAESYAQDISDRAEELLNSFDRQWAIAKERQNSGLLAAVEGQVFDGEIVE